MLHVLRRHPIPVSAYFKQCLVLTYAFPHEALTPLLPPGLALDTFGAFGFLAIAMVQTLGLRPTVLPPSLGQDFFLTGYRVFAKHRTREGRTLRGLRILRSDADRRLMVTAGNCLTHYNYQLCSADLAESDGRLEVRIETPGGVADLHVVAQLHDESPWLPPGSPFHTEREARRFAGPLPYTFDYERQTHSIVRIKGVRERWSPRLVRVDVRRAAFLATPPLGAFTPALASAFHTAGVPYRWERGVRERLPGVAT